jgi:polysaccharide deacetylase 2 family uncharacterized protein YibQ
VTDEFNVPLGLEPKKKRRRSALPRFVPYAVLGLLAAALAGFAGWAVIVDDPLGGEPMAVAAIDKSAPRQAKPGEEKDAPAVKPEGGAAKPDADGTKNVTVIDGMSGRRQHIALSASGVARDEVAGPAGKVVVSPSSKTPAEIAKEQSPLPTVRSGTPQSPKPSPGPPQASAAATQLSPAATSGAEPAGSDSRPQAPQADKGPPIDQRLTESTRHGLIPKVGPNGMRASEVYASPLARAAKANGGAQVAIVIGRLGVSAKGTEDALSKLPASVTVAFAPYGSNLHALVGRARTDGREVLLQVPMEPFDYPDNDPGPQALLTSLSPDQNTDRLHWFMSRIQGYVGVGNYMGARFAANEPAVSTVMREIGKRGLIYFDDGSVTRSLVGQVAAVNGVPFARADVVIDAGRSAADIDAALARLEALARERGSAVGVALPLPASIDHIARWAASAGARGITLVPISVIANKAKSS